MKKLLILGGISLAKEIVEQAHQMGIEVCVTDYLSDSPAKAIADKSFMVSTTDVDAVVDLIRQEKIDGVLTGYIDLLLPYYVEICEKAGLPCYATREQIAVTTDKAKFKTLCREYSVPTVPEYTYVDVVDGNVRYPLLVKPVDNSGARGVYVCHDFSEFERAYEASMSFSKSKRVLIERYMTGKEATIFYYLHEGKIYLTGMGNRHMLKFDESLIPLPVGYTFPSVMLSEFMKKESPNIVKMFESLRMREGMIFVQSFVESGTCMVYEMGYRLTGSIEHHLIKQSCGFDPLAAMIDYAVGNGVHTELLERVNPMRGILANVTLLLKEGIINHYEGIDEAKKVSGVLHIFLSYGVGMEIDKKIMGTLAQVGLRVLLWAEDKESLIGKMDQVKDIIKVKGQSGEDMVVNDYKYSCLIDKSDIL